MTLAVGASRSPAEILSFRQEVLADNPVGYWRFGETLGSTVAVDETGQGSDGAYLQAVTLGVPGALATDENTAARFDGASGVSQVVSSPQ